MGFTDSGQLYEQTKICSQGKGHPGTYSKHLALAKHTSHDLHYSRPKVHQIQSNHEEDLRLENGSLDPPNLGRDAPSEKHAVSPSMLKLRTITT
jgi:hypothetical protein